MNRTALILTYHGALTVFGVTVLNYGGPFAAVGWLLAGVLLWQWLDRALLVRIQGELIRHQFALLEALKPEGAP